MLSVSPILFRSNQTVQNQQQHNSMGLSENAQKILNSTNKYANTCDLIDTIVNQDKNTDNLLIVAKNAMLMPIMSKPFVSAIYAADQYNKGNISKEDATKLVACNTITQFLSA